jgi:DNA-binding CsgD family transcriptional regulator
MSTGFATTRIPTNPSTPAMRLSTPASLQHESVPCSVELGLLDLLVQDSPIGIIVIERSSRVVFANPRGLKILERNDGLSLAGGALCEHDSQVLEPRLKALLRGETSPAGEFSPPFHLPRPSGRRPYEITLRVANPGEGAGALPSPRQVAIYVRDPERGVPIDVESLRKRYLLTPAEARTLAALVRGGTLQQNSLLLKLRPMTIRGYIKQIFAKTMTHSQLDLLRLVLIGTSSMVDDTPEH